MKGKMNTDMGEIVIDRDVLAKYAGTATTDCIGIVGIEAAGREHLLDFIKAGSYRRDLGRGALGSRRGIFRRHDTQALHELGVSAQQKTGGKKKARGNAEDQHSQNPRIARTHLDMFAFSVAHEASALHL